jgi:prolyl 4-hydroxylase
MTKTKLSKRTLSLFSLLLILQLIPTLSYSEENQEPNDEDLTLELWQVVDAQAAAINASNDRQSFSERTLLGAIGYFAPNNSSDSCLDDERNYNCEDQLDSCETMARRGECLFRSAQCAKACLICPPSSDTSTFKIGETQGIPKDLIVGIFEHSLEQGIEDFKLPFSNMEALMIETAQIIIQTQDYMSNIVMQDPTYEKVRRSCLNYDEHCSSYAALGYCQSDFLGGDDFVMMMSKCAPACQACNEFELVQPCDVNFNFNVFQEGDLETMFRRMAGELDIPKHQLPFVPQVLSRPGGGDGAVDGAWLVTLEDFLTPEDCDRLIELGALKGYARSGLQDEEDKDEYRTSVNAWCDDDCAEDPTAKDVVKRISQTVGIPSEYSESLQMLKYTEGQYYKVHHDVALDSEFLALHGPRIITFFLYLNDVEEGGATRMVDVTNDDDDNENDDSDDEEDSEKDDSDDDDDSEKEEKYTPTPMDIQPKRGMAVVWANLNDKDMKKREDGTWHEALPVIRGVKYGANAWYRLRRFTDDCDEDVFDEWEEKHNIDDDDDDDNDDDNDDDDDDDDVDDNNDNKDEGDSNENVATITA